MQKSIPIVRSHHERLDGSGYPDGLSGADVSLAVRIVTVADIFDALTTGRVYRAALRREAAYEIFDDEVRRGWWDGEVLRELQAAVAETDTHPTPDPGNSS